MLVFQSYALYPHLTVLQNIIFPLQNLKGKDKLTKEQMLEKAFALCGLDETTKTGALMVGDRCFDIDGANDAGIDSMGVLYGFGSREELTASGATHLVQSAAEAQALLLNG